MSQDPRQLERHLRPAMFGALIHTLHCIALHYLIYNIYFNIYIYIYYNVYIYIYVCMYIYICVYIYVYVYLCIIKLTVG